MKNILIRNCICSHTNCFKSILVTRLSSFHENIDVTARLDMDMDMDIDNTIIVSVFIKLHPPYLLASLKIMWI